MLNQYKYIQLDIKFIIAIFVTQVEDCCLQSFNFIHIFVLSKMPTFRIRNWLYKAFLGDNEKEVHWHVIPVHIWSIQTSQRMVQAQDNDGGLTATTINKEQHLVSKHTINMRHEELLSANSHDSILYRMLKLQGLSRAYRRLMMRKVAALARSMTMPNVRPIFVVISKVITYMSKRIMEYMIEEVDNEAHVTTIRFFGFRLKVLFINHVFSINKKFQIHRVLIR